MSNRSQFGPMAIDFFVGVLYTSCLETITADKGKLLLALAAAGRECPAVEKQLSFTSEGADQKRRWFWLTHHRATDELDGHVMTLLSTHLLGRHPFDGSRYILNTEPFNDYVEKRVMPLFDDATWLEIERAGNIFTERLAAYEDLGLHEAFVLEYPDS